MATPLYYQNPTVSNDALLDSQTVDTTTTPPTVRETVTVGDPTDKTKIAAVGASGLHIDVASVGSLVDLLTAILLEIRALKMAVVKTVTEAGDALPEDFGAPSYEGSRLEVLIKN